MRSKLAAWLPLLIPVAFALFVRLAFGMDLFRDWLTIMTVSFFLTVPFAMGYLTIALSPVEAVKKRKYRILAPWIPIFLFLVVTLLLQVEGWACWIMILPVFLAFASLGGWVAGRRKLRRQDRPGKLQVSLVMLLPFLLTPLERMIPHIPTMYTAYTFIDIRAPAEKIWSNVVRVRAIPETEDHGWLTRMLGFPRPIRAELDYAGVGGSRQAVFSKGLVFEEVVKEYEDQRKMHFSIKADPHKIPSATMDEHVVIGGDYFDVLDGTYELKPLNDSVCRLHLYSHFTLNTSFNFYGNFWAGWIMKDIQSNILQVIRTRCQE